MQFRCNISHDRSYSIFFEWNLIDKLATILEENRLTGSVFIVSDHNVFRQHGKRLLEGLRPFEAKHLLVAPGETSKSLRNWKRIQNFLLQNGADRKSTIIAFGGGVVGDLTGFAASTYMRGIRLVQIPTTILSQSDSSIGAKVAINHPRAKNLIGSFYQPSIIVSDPSLLRTLPRREFSAGLGEAIKYGVIAAPEIFEMLYADIERILAYDQELIGSLISRCIDIKIRVVEEDEQEIGLRKILNFGHTVGHAMEQATGYKRLRHGEAVAWGMIAAGRIAVKRGMWAESEFAKLQSIIERAGSLYPYGTLSAEDILEALKHDKKKQGSP